MGSGKRTAIFALCLLFLASASVAAAKDRDNNIQKEVVNRPWEKAADSNKDGIVDETEMERWKQSHPDVPAVLSSTEESVGSVPDNLEDKAVVDQKWEKAADLNNDGVVDDVEIRQWRKAGHDNDNNPPGKAGGPGTNWENPPGPQGGPGASPNRRGGNVGHR